MVVSVSPPASEVGLRALQAGGNAVDAAVAVALALAVTYPPAGNIGGGGFMMIHPADGPPVCIDYRETAPGTATATMFADSSETLGHRVVGVPGTLRGLELAHRKWGRLPWRDLVALAIELAEKGFALDRGLADSLNEIVRDSQRFSELRRVFGARSEAGWRAGDTLIQPDLAETLRQVAEHGAETLYSGAVAERLLAEMRAGGGLIESADLRAYQAREREPIHGVFRGYDIFAPPPPSSGGVCLVQMLKVLEAIDLRSQVRGSIPAIHFEIEAMRRAFLDRALYLGDPDFTSIPAFLTSKEYAKKLADSIDPDRASSSAELAPEITLAGEGSSTTHFSVIDGQGMAVANTYTLEQSYGSRVIPRGAGFLLNNEMGDFNWRPGHTDRSGKIGTKPNQIAPGKRMLSSQTPTIVAKDGKVVLVTGSPGGRTIINTVLGVLLNTLEFGQDARSAVDAPRFHHAWFPDVVKLESPFAGDSDGETRGFDASLIDGLRDLGHVVEVEVDHQGDAHTIHVVDGVYHGIADHRILGQAAGY